MSPRDPVRTPLVVLVLLAVCAGGLRLSCTVIRAAPEIESWRTACFPYPPVSSVAGPPHQALARHVTNGHWAREPQPARGVLARRTKYLVSGRAGCRSW